MRVGLQLPSFTFPGGTPAIRPTLTAIAQAAEANGFASLWVMDHFFQLPGTPAGAARTKPMLEAYTTLGFLAQATERIALGPMVGERRRSGRPACSSRPPRRSTSCRRPDRTSRHRCRVVRARGERPRAAMADARRAVRAARGDAPHRARDVRRATRRRSRAATTGSPSRSTPAGTAGRGQPADHDRRRRGAEDASASSPSTRTPATSSSPTRREPPQARGPAAPLRGVGRDFGRDRDDIARRGRPAPGRQTPADVVAAVPRPGRRGHRARDRQPPRRARPRAPRHVRPRGHPGRRLTPNRRRPDSFQGDGPARIIGRTPGFPALRGSDDRARSSY